MKRIHFDPEVLYVQKLYYFFFLSTFSIIVAGIIGWRFSLYKGLLTLFVGFILSYLAMLAKNTFAVPNRRILAQRMAREISQNTSPIIIARFASQLYFYFNENTQAISLLEKFIHTNDPLLCATFGDILLKEGKPKQALYVLRENPYAVADPLLLAIQGHVLRHLGKINEAIKIYERSLRLAKKAGFPHNGAHWLTQKLLTVSYSASIHHALADCYNILKDSSAARRHYRAGNIRLLDITLWRGANSPPLRSARSYTKSS